MSIGAFRTSSHVRRGLLDCIVTAWVIVAVFIIAALVRVIWLCPTTELPYLGSTGRVPAMATVLSESIAVRIAAVRCRGRHLFNAPPRLQVRTWIIIYYIYMFSGVTDLTVTLFNAVRWTVNRKITKVRRENLRNNKS